MYTICWNVLKISQLDNSKISLIKNDIDIHSVIHEATDRISLLLNTNNGKINLDLKAENSIFKMSFEELTKVFVNLLENSIKYSNNNPEIYIKTRNYNKKLEITDELEETVIYPGIQLTVSSKSRNLKNNINQKLK